jgi:protein SCO1/2
MKNRISLALIFILGAAFLTAWWMRPQGSILPPGGDFTLHSADGEISLHDFRQRVVLLYFGYTSCPDVCPTNLANLAASLKRLSNKGRQSVQVIFISVDPDRDTPAHLKQYTAFFDPSFIGVTSDAATVAKVARAYGVSYKKVEYPGAMGYLVDHSSLTYVIGPNGKLRETLPHAAPKDQITSVVRHWLAKQ